MKVLQARPYQAEAAQKIKDHLFAGMNNQVVELPTGTGKTVLFSILPKLLNIGNRRMLLLVHREELAKQAVDKLRMWNPGISIGTEMGSKYAEGSQIVVAGVQTLGKAGSQRLAELDPNHFAIIVTDECFTAGTLVDGRPIESLEVGDMVTAFDEPSNTLVKRRIVRLFSNPAKQLVGVTIAGHRTVCTPRHPFYTQRGWVPAHELQRTDLVIRYGLHSVQRSGDEGAEKPSIDNVQEDRKSVLLGCLYERLLSEDLIRAYGEDEQAARLDTYEAEQPDEQPALYPEDEKHSTSNAAQASTTWGERDRCHGAGIHPPHRPTFRRQFRDVPTIYNSEDSPEEGVGLSAALQGGYWMSPLEAGYRSRRILPLPIVQAGAGSEERATAAWVGVDGVEVLEQGSDGTFGGMCPDGFVYNIEVEHSHTYIANGVVVHNCHHSLGDTYQRVFNHFNVRTRNDILNLGVTATTKRGDGKGLKGTYDVVSYSMSLLTAIREGWLCDLKGKRIVTGVDFDSISIKNGDFDPLELVAKLNTDVNNDLIVKHYLTEAKGRKFIAFCQDVAHSQALASAFREKGLAVEAVWGVDPDRTSKLAKHRNNELIGLVNAELLTEGYDDWQIRCVIIDKVTLSEGKYRQMVGRGTRIEEGIYNRVEALEEGYTLKKPDCLILDVVGNSTKHSLHTLPTLFGFGTNTNLKDRTVLEAVEEVEELRLTNPSLDVMGLDDITNLKSYARTVDLMADLLLPELIQLSEYKWQKVGEDRYALPLINDEFAAVVQDNSGVWHAKGSVNTYQLEGTFPDLESAIKECDYNVRMLGGRMWVAKARRTQKLDDAPASDASLHVMRMYNMEPPVGITQGMARALIFKAMNQETFEERNRNGGASD